MSIGLIISRNSRICESNMVVFALTLIRHGETGHNKDNVIQGQMDVPLSPTGLKQAQLLGCHLQHQKYTHVYVSDLSRARQTADSIIKENHSYQGSPVPDVRLRERKFGIVEGKNFKFLKEAAAEVNQPVGQFTPPGGETVQQVHERAVSFFEDLCKMIKEKSKFESLSEHVSNVSCSKGNTAHFENANHVCEGKVMGHKRKRENSENEVAPKVECTNRSDKKFTTTDSGSNIRSDSMYNHQVLKRSEEANVRNLNKLPSLHQGGTEYSDSKLGNNTEHSGEPVEVATAINPNNSCVVDSDSVSVLETNKDRSEQFSVTFTDDAIRSCIASHCDPLDSECPNVSLSPLVDHTIPSTTISASSQNKGPSNGQAERRLSVCSSTDDLDSGPPMIANILIVSHGGLLRELLRYFVEELQCTVPGGKKQALRISPNAGLSKFTVAVEEHDGNPKIICHQIHDKQHLLSELNVCNAVNGDAVAL